MLISLVLSHAVKLLNDMVNYWPGEICKKCLNRNNIGFIVPDSIWKEVVQGRYNVLCPTCFDKLAEEREVKYVFGEIFPISWSAWLDD